MGRKKGGSVQDFDAELPKFAKPKNLCSANPYGQRSLIEGKKQKRKSGRPKCVVEESKYSVLYDPKIVYKIEIHVI